MTSWSHAQSGILAPRVMHSHVSWPRESCTVRHPDQGIFSLLFFRYIHQPLNPNDPPGVALPKPAYSYQTVGCVFNHQSLYANCQVCVEIVLEFPPSVLTPPPVGCLSLYLVWWYCITMVILISAHPGTRLRGDV